MIKIQESPIDILELNNDVNISESGAIVTFVGTVRNHDESSKTEIKALYYEAYEEMAIKKIDEIIDEAKNKFHIKKVSIIQRIGTIGVKEASIGIAVSSEHRKNAFLACEYIIDKIKEISPIWKKEIYADNSEIWKSETG